MPESLPVGQRVPLAPIQIARDYRQALGDRRFLTPVIGVGLRYAVLFMIIGGTPFVPQELYGLSVVAYGVVFGVLAVSMALVAPIAGRLAAHIGEAPTARSGAGLVVLGGAALPVALWLQAPLWAVITALLLVMAGLGLAEPALLSVSMGAATNIGTHWAVLGTAQYLLGAAPSSLTDPQPPAQRDSMNITSD